MRKNCLYERSLGKWVQYSEEAYLKLSRDRARTRMSMGRQSRCFCPRNEVWRCDGCCEGCPHYKGEEEVSLNTVTGHSGELTLEDVLTDDVDQENACVEKMYYEDILKRLDEIMPQAREIGVLRMQGKSDREIAKILGIPRTSMYRMLERAKQILEEKFGEN